jgi:hypothetical protein
VLRILSRSQTLRFRAPLRKAAPCGRLRTTLEGQTKVMIYRAAVLTLDHLENAPTANQAIFDVMLSRKPVSAPGCENYRSGALPDNSEFGRA